jgi:hypothetical protein
MLRGRKEGFDGPRSEHPLVQLHRLNILCEVVDAHPAEILVPGDLRKNAPQSGISRVPCPRGRVSWPEMTR